MARQSSRNSNRRNRTSGENRRNDAYGENRFEGRFQSLYTEADRQEEEEEYTRGFRFGRKKNTRSNERSNARSGNSRSRQSSDRNGDNGTRRYDEWGFEVDRSFDRNRVTREGNNRNGGRGNGNNKEDNRLFAIDLSGLKTSKVGKRTGAMIKKANGDPEKQKRFTLPERNDSNFTLLACVILLLIIGLIMVTSSSYYYAYNTMDDSMYYFRRQVIWTLVSIVAMILVSRAPLSWIRGLAFPIYLFSIFCSILVFFFGQAANGSTRWLGVGSLSFQPSELSKLAVAIYISKLVDDNRERMGELSTFGIILFAILVPTALVAYQNLSSGIIVAAIGVIIMFVGGARIKHFMMIIGPMAALVVLLIVLPLLVDTSNMNGPLGEFLSDFAYRTSRVSAWLDPFGDAMGDGYQTVQALYAVGSGGFFGRGLGQSIQKLGYIPFAYNDIIFAVICEELGLFGAGIVSALFAIFAWNGVKISLNSPNRYTMYLSMGLVGQIALQAVLNIAVNTNSMPATGISLPFISYGGSSMLFLMASVGLILNISTYGASEKRKTAAPEEVA